MMKRVDIRPIQRDPILRAELKARYWGGRVGELSLGDVLLAGPRAVALLEFKREANWEGRWKEHSKLLEIEAVLEHPKFENLRDTSKRVGSFAPKRRHVNRSHLGSPIHPEDGYYRSDVWAEPLYTPALTIVRLAAT
jgi:hypothetical protein